MTELSGAISVVLILYMILLLGIGSVPAVVIDGQLAECCGQGINEETLKAAGLGQALDH